MAYPYHQQQYAGLQHYPNGSQPPPSERPLMRASSAPYYSSSNDNLLQDYMKNLSSRKGEFVTGGSKPPLKPALSMVPSTTGRKDEMVAGNSYVYQRVRKTQAAKDRTTQSSSSHHNHSQQHEASSRDRERRRRRSVSPEMQRKPLVSSQPASLPTIESPSSKQVQLHKKLSKKKINMSRVENRLKTFERMPKWEVEGVGYSPIASAGFYYTGQEDITKCFECDIVVSGWSAHDDPLELHFNKNPNCAYLRKDHPMAVEDLCNSKFDMYKELSVRVKSFNTYPHRGYPIDAKSIANSGFFYTGADDKTQCFACGLVKRNWTKEDDPIVVHRNFYSECPHLKKLGENSSVQHANMHACSDETAALKKPDYSIANIRLLSFKHYSLHTIDKEEFVDAGFFLLSPPQTVKCFACSLVIDNWLPGDNPLKKHYQLNSSCPFLQDKDVSSSSPSDSSSLPPPIYSYNEMVNKFKGSSFANEPERQDERKDAIASAKDRELFNLPIHLPPKYKMRGATSSTPPYHTYPSTESSTPGSPSDETFHSLNEDDKLCIICFDKLKEYAIIPCGHLCTCGDCSEKLRNCPVCRRPKQSVIRIFNT